MKKVEQECGLPAGPTLRVQKEQCSTCIFKPDSNLNLRKLLDDVRDFTVPGFVFFKGYRVCHHSDDAVCAGFWRSFKDKFALGQIAQHLGLVEYVRDDVDPLGDDMSNKTRAKREARIARQREPQQGKLFTTNLAAQALRTYRPEEHGGLTEAELKHATDEANGRLEPKAFPLSGSGLTKPLSESDRQSMWSGMRSMRQRSKGASAGQQRVVQLPPEPVIVIAEPTLLAAMEEARAAGRTTMTSQDLHALLAQHHPISYRDQKGYVKERRP